MAEPTELQRAVRNRLAVLRKPGVTAEEKRAAWGRVQAAEKAEHDVMLASITGRSIVRIDEVDHSTDSSGGWCEHLAYELTLDDGRVLCFNGWGHDAWGCDVSVALPVELEPGDAT